LTTQKETEELKHRVTEFILYLVDCAS